ncbi:MAG: hypothetical protein ACFFDY_02925 [Candidatus Thorarchaeota archaeon]
MSKIPKQKENEKKLKKKPQSDENFAFRSVIVSAIFGGIFLIISLFFNTEIITIFLNRGTFWTFIDILIKVITILLFFLFMITSIGNYKELIGKPLNWKELLLVFLFSIGQTILNVWVFIFTLFGLVLLLIYLYIIQEF